MSDNILKNFQEMFDKTDGNYEFLFFAIGMQFSIIIDSIKYLSIFGEKIIDFEDFELWHKRFYDLFEKVHSIEDFMSIYGLDADLYVKLKNKREEGLVPDNNDLEKFLGVDSLENVSKKGIVKSLIEKSLTIDQNKVKSFLYFDQELFQEIVRGLQVIDEQNENLSLKELKGAKKIASVINKDAVELMKKIIKDSYEKIKKEDFGSTSSWNYMYKNYPWLKTKTHKDLRNDESHVHFSNFDNYSYEEILKKAKYMTFVCCTAIIAKNSFLDDLYSGWLEQIGASSENILKQFTDEEKFDKLLNLLDN